MSGQLARGSRLVVATHNAGKVAEIGDLLRPFGLDAVSAGSLGLPAPAETGHMFADNAAIKAHAAAQASGLVALADDSGLCVDALDGAPGLFSADWAGSGRDFAEAMARVEHELQLRGARSPAQRRAHFVCALVLAWPDGAQQLFEGRVFGQVVWPPRGTSGFGYDPMFLPDGHASTFGEIERDVKHAMSHRAEAFRKLVAACLG